MSFLLLFLITYFIGNAIGDEVRINSVEEFIQFKDNVSSGTNYSGTTVLLNFDLEFTENTFNPIGYYNGENSRFFSGVFDGQGHAIRNLAINSSSSEYAGLFGYSTGLTIRNVILDSSCTITSSLDGSHNAFIGGFIGHCYANDGHFTIENSVNMASDSFTGNISYCLHLGGIAGKLGSLTKYDSIVKNCANYGDVTHFGACDGSRIGGIVGSSYGDSTPFYRIYIYNTINYGTVAHSGTNSGSFFLGGIAGDSQYTDVENCVNAGSISSNKNYYVGSIVGYVWSDTSINYCYATSELRSYNKYGAGTPIESNILNYDSTTFELDWTVSVGGYNYTSLINALNAASDY